MIDRILARLTVWLFEKMKQYDAWLDDTEEGL